ncbi:hypothetical protein ES702_02614 [subsurface metagenome]
MSKFNFSSLEEKTKSKPLPIKKVVSKPIIAPKIKTKVTAKPKKSKKKVPDICLECNRKYIIFQDKDMNKEEILKDITNNILKNGDLLTLDFWRGQKFNYDNLFEMRKT